MSKRPRPPTSASDGNTRSFLVRLKLGVNSKQCTKITYFWIGCQCRSIRVQRLAELRPTSRGNVRFPSWCLCTMEVKSRSRFLVCKKFFKLDIFYNKVNPSKTTYLLLYGPIELNHKTISSLSLYKWSCSSPATQIRSASAKHSGLKNPNRRVIWK